MVGQRPRLGSILVEQEVITQQELEAAVLYQIRAESAAGRTLLADAVSVEGRAPAARSPRLGEALIALGICTDVQVARALACQMEVPFVDLEQTPPLPEALTLIPREVAQAYGVLPVRVEDGRLLLASFDPAASRAIEVVQQLTGLPVQLAGAAESQVREYLKRYDGPAPGSGEETEAAAVRPARSETAGMPGPFAEAENPSAMEAVNRLIEDAARKHASDLYFEPTEEGIRIQYRMDGELRTVATLRRRMLQGMIAHVKMICGMELTEKPRPQDGRCRVRVDGRPIQLHASTLPGIFGESAILRFVG
jgi:type IV pilus assembly protein PilB